MVATFTGLGSEKILKECDVVVVGAGAAGLKATTDLIAAKKSVVLVEAMDRWGGRAFTSTSLCQPFDEGCQWLHDKEWWIEANRLGVNVAVQSQICYASNQGWSTAAFDPLSDALGELDTALEGKGDVTAKSVFEKVKKKKQSDASFMAAYELAASLIGTLDEGIEPEKFSAADRGAESDDDDDEEEADLDDYQQGCNYLAEGGFGALIARYGQELVDALVQSDGSQLALNTAATNIKYSGAERIKAVVRPHGGAHHVVRCRAVIVTASTAVINSGQLAFTPALGPELSHAFEVLPMGHFKKIALQFSQNIWGGLLDPEVDEGATYDKDQVLYHYDPETATSWKFLIRFAPQSFAAGTHVVVAMVGGRVAQDLDQNDQKARDWTLRIIRKITGNNRITATKCEMSTWSANRWVQGAYSYTAPGGAGARKLIARSAVDGRIFFAGEALWSSHYGTAHGAYRTGRIAAKRVLELLASD